jgi:hypothetical protein
MTRKECFRILGLAETASEAEIRKQYKKLAMRMHPDVNPDPKAHESFIRLSQAVEILLNGDSENVDNERKSRRKTGTETEEELESRMRKAKERFEFQQRQEALDEHRYFLSLTSGKRWFYYKIICSFSVFFAIILVLDTWLPTRYESDRMTHIDLRNRRNGINHEDIVKIILEQRGSYYIEFKPILWEYTYPSVRIETTRILHSPIKIYATDDFNGYTGSFDFHLYSIRYLLIGMFLLPLIPYFRPRKTIGFVVLYMISFWGNGTLLLYLICTENRFIHLITFGYL